MFTADETNKRRIRTKKKMLRKDTDKFVLRLPRKIFMHIWLGNDNGSMMMVYSYKLRPVVCCVPHNALSQLQLVQSAFTHIFYVHSIFVRRVNACSCCCSERRAPRRSGGGAGGRCTVHIGSNSIFKLLLRCCCCWLVLLCVCVCVLFFSFLLCTLFYTHSQAGNLSTDDGQPQCAVRAAAAAHNVCENMQA